MKTKMLFLLLAGFLILPSNSNGQIGYLRNKIVNKIIDDQIDSIGKEKKTENTESQGTNANTSTSTQTKENASSQGSFNLGNLGIGKVDLKHKDQYDFDGSIYMQMETYDKKEVTKMDYYTYYNSSSPDVAIEVKTISDDKDAQQANSVFVFDGENKCLLMLTEMDGNKSGIISAIPSDSALKAQNAGKPVTKPTIVKTGKTRVIAGYNCDEYKITDVENKTYSNVWASKDIDLKADRSNWNKAGLPAYTTSFEGGLVLAMESYDNKDVLQMKTETIEIKPNIKHSVSPTGYTLMQMKFNQGTGK